MGYSLIITALLLYQSTPYTILDSAQSYGVEMPAIACEKGETNNTSNLITRNAKPDPGYVIVPDPGTGSKELFTAKTYFENLKTYSPINNDGSCGYVSLIQLMSYYDTFYNDNIIPEYYEYKQVGADTHAKALSDSPGVLGEHWRSTNYDSYFLYCLNTLGYNLQSALTMARNFKEESNREDLFEPGIGAWDYQETLNSFYANRNMVDVILYRYKTQEQYKDIIKKSIDEKHPVIVHVDNKGNPSKGEAHSVVAYDYDDHGIYAHFGWGGHSSRYKLIGEYYSNIYMVAKLNYSKIGHSHSNNYIIDGREYCGCGAIV